MMRFMWIFFCAAGLLICVNSYARNLHDLDKPMLLNAGKAKRMYVLFNHSSHNSVPCANCHHEGLPGNRYAPCASRECHAITAPSSREVLSIYMAYHAPDTRRSCYGCHKRLAGKYPGFHGCSPCHETPMGSRIVTGSAAN